MSRRNTRRRWQSHVCGGRQTEHGAAYGVERREPPEGTVSANGKISRYTYNAADERIIKSHRDLESVYVNGAP